MRQRKMASSASRLAGSSAPFRRSCLFACSIILLCFSLATLFAALHITSSCPLSLRKYMGDPDEIFNHPCNSRAALASHSLSSPANTSRSIHPAQAGVDPDWKPWKLPPELLSYFPAEESSRLDPSQFHLEIKLLTFDRIGPATRFLQSLKRANFLGDSVSLEILIDHPFNAAKGWGKRLPWQRAAAMKARKAMLAMLDNFTWPHGTKTVHARSLNSGIQPQWMEAWWPETVNHFAFIAEDDTELSPFFYVYFKRLVMFYYYNQANFDPKVYGISFQRQWLVPGFYGNKMAAPGEPFLYPLIGTWGQFVFPIPWKDYRMWYEDNRYQPGKDPSIGKMITTQFWKNKGNTIWTPWQIQWAYVRHSYNLYTGFPRNLSLSVSHRTSGVNFRKSMGPDAVLLTPSHLPSEKLPSNTTLERGGGGESFLGLSSSSSSSSSSSNESSSVVHPDWWTVMPGLREIKKYDFCFRRVPTLGTPVRSIQDLEAALPAFGAKRELAILMVPGTDQAYRKVRNWLCFLDGLNRHNYLLLFSLYSTAVDPSVTPADGSGVTSCMNIAERFNERTEKIAKDLASRGHLVYVISAPEYMNPATECRPEVLEARENSLMSTTQAKAVSQILELGVSVLVSSLATVWRHDPFVCDPFQSGEHVMSWMLVPPESQFIHSFVLWVKSTDTGKSAFRKVVNMWANEGMEDLAMLHVSKLAAAEGPLGMIKLLPDGRRSRSSRKPSALARCVASGPWKPGKELIPAIQMVPRTIPGLKQESAWLVDDVFFACKSVTCKRT